MGAFRDPLRSLPVAERKVIFQAVVRGQAVEDSRLASSAVLYGRWLSRFGKRQAVMAGTATVAFVAAALTAQRGTPVIGAAAAFFALWTGTMWFLSQRFRRGQQANATVAGGDPPAP